MQTKRAGETVDLIQSEHVALGSLLAFLKACRENLVCQRATLSSVYKHNSGATSTVKSTFQLGLWNLT